MKVTGFVAVSRPGDIQRMVKWEASWIPVGDGYEAKTIHPTIWEWTYLDVSNPRRIEYSGPEFKWVPTAITEMSWAGTQAPQWPREAPTEIEFARRDRIRKLRKICHIDEDRGTAEPEWAVQQRESLLPLPVMSAAA
jgi:hypothetical protein